MNRDSSYLLSNKISFIEPVCHKKCKWNKVGMKKLWITFSLIESSREKCYLKTLKEIPIIKHIWFTYENKSTTNYLDVPRVLWNLKENTRKPEWIMKAGFQNSQHKASTTRLPTNESIIFLISRKHCRCVVGYMIVFSTKCFFECTKIQMPHSWWSLIFKNEKATTTRTTKKIKEHIHAIKID